MSVKKQLSDKQKIKKKMSKAQIQLAIIKKKQCDAKALAIVEQLLELNVNSNWLLQNLGFISKSHMEDVIEERSISKICGYVLCSNPLTTVIKQQYHISTRMNKVYDISRRKKFCSSLCYGAYNYLLEQMLESPLWLREKEDIPVFQILHTNSMSAQCVPGDEIDVAGINLSQNIGTDNIDEDKDPTEHNTANTTTATEQAKEYALPTSLPNPKLNPKLKNSVYLSDNTDKHNIDDSMEFMSHENDYDGHNIQEVNVKLENMEIQNKFENIHNDNLENKNVNINVVHSNDNILQPYLNEINNSQNDADKKPQFNLSIQSNEINNIPNETVQLQLDEACNSQSTTLPSQSSNECRKERNANKINKNKRSKQKESNNTQMQANIYHELTLHVEQSVREWITKDTLCFLLGDVDEKHKLLENLTQQDKYQQLCKKLNRLQMEDEKEDRVNLEKNVLKPLPHLSVLQEEGKKMELKVRAFYQGQLTITPTEDSNKESESKVDPILPLTDIYAPNALRRRIFLDKLSKIVPDLLHALTANANTSHVAQCIYDERYSLMKLLIRTFNLSATNIIFKTAEWQLVGLIIIKMLSLTDAQLQSLLRSKQASMYMSMILMSYKLDTNYLDRLIMEVTNNVVASMSDIKEC